MIEWFFALIASVISALIAEFLKLYMQIFKPKKNIESYIMTGRIQDVAFEKYKKRLADRYNTVKVLRFNKPIPLRGIFVKVNIHNKHNTEQPFFNRNVENEIIKKDNESNGNENIQDGVDAINEFSKLVVLGKPGSGKTTFLKRIALMSVDNELQEPLVPIFINLHSWSRSNQSLFETIVTEFHICGYAEPMKYVEGILRDGKCLLLLDGFDEIHGNVSQALYEIQKFTDTYIENRFILSCRTAVWNYIFDNFVIVEIMDFDNIQIKTFIQNWYSDNSSMAQYCLEIISENNSINGLITNPLLLAIFCASMNENKKNLTNLVDFYKYAITRHLDSWDGMRNILRNKKNKQEEKIYTILSLQTKIDILSSIAEDTFYDNNYLIERRYIKDKSLFAISYG